MLRVTAQKNAAGAKAYFARSDYYSEGQELIGNWGGRGAVYLGLFGAVDKPHFDQLCDNIHPQTGDHLTALTKDGRRVGYDLTWSVPKSVSIVHALTGDDRVVEAFRASIRDTMGEMEADMQARVRKGGEQHDRDTGNMVWAEFVHLTSRPVDGIPCPQLHAHCFVFNATFDAEEDQWKAGQFGKIKGDAHYWQTVQQSRLVNRLQQLGYGVRRTEKDFEIVGVPESAIKKFSLRTQQIEQRAMELGVTRPETKAKLGATTREAKNDAIPYSRLVEIWENRLTDQERNAIGDLPRLDAVPPRDDARHARFAVEHSFERSSVVNERRLLTLALRHGLGEVTPEGIRAEANRRGLLKREENGKTWVTTKEVLAEEQKMMGFAVAGKGTCRPLADKKGHPDPEQPFGSISKSEALGLELHKGLPGHGKGVPSDSATLSDEQQAVIDHLLTSQDRVMLVRGVAGAGKTTVANPAVKQIEAAGHRVTMMAPTTPAVDVLRKDGFEANTLARFLVDERMQAAARNGVIWLDEAGLIGSRSMASLFQLADSLNARVVLMGDKRQLASVERGSPFRVLEEIAKLPVAEVSEIRRQSGEYKEAVKLLAKGSAAEGFDRLNGLGWVKTMPVWEPYKPVAREYVDALQRKETALVICPTHAEGEKVTEAIRDRLKREGKLGDEEREFRTLQPVHLTEAERKDGSLLEGYTAAFFRRAGSYTAGQRVRVSGENVVALSPWGRSFSVFADRKLHLAAGDAIRITAKGKTLADKSGVIHSLNNGSHYTVKGFTRDGDIALTNGWTLSKDFGHFTHGYVSTDYGAQGRTVDRVLVVASEQSYPAVNARGFYVDVSRARKSATVWTDSRRDLREAIQRSDPRMSATELAAKARPKLWHRVRQAMGRIRQNAFIAAKRAAYEIQQSTMGRQHEYAQAIER